MQQKNIWISLEQQSHLSVSGVHLTTRGRLIEKCVVVRCSLFSFFLLLFGWTVALTHTSPGHSISCDSTFLLITLQGCKQGCRLSYRLCPVPFVNIKTPMFPNTSSPHCCISELHRTRYEYSKSMLWILRLQPNLQISLTERIFFTHLWETKGIHRDLAKIRLKIWSHVQKCPWKRCGCLNIVFCVQFSVCYQSELALMCVWHVSREQGAPVIHFQVQLAAVQSHFNTNCFRPDKCACALRLTPPVSACNATLVAVDTKYQLLSQPQTRKKTKTKKKIPA